jgi:Xaa-Pro aminopeptidase
MLWPSFERGSVGLGRLPAQDFSVRLGALREAFGPAGCDALVVSSLANVRYLTGFSGSAGLVLVRDDGAVLVTDGRYGTSARAQLATAGLAGAGVRVEAVPAAEQPGLLAELAAGCRSVGLEAEHVSWAQKRAWSEGWAKGAELVATAGVVERLRERKAPEELARLAAAAAVADEAFRRVLAMLEAGSAGRGGPSEVDVAVALEAEMRHLGAEAPAFDTIVASGPGGAEPHHRPGSRQVVRGDMVTIDFGARVDGYCSDATRTVVVGAGAPSLAELGRIYSVVLAAQDAGLAAVREGALASEVDRACREVVDAAGMGELFVHGTGHGVGLLVHEAPALSASSGDILMAGQVVTVEPGVYLPGVGGARVEDTVVVCEAGCELLTLAPKTVVPASR